MALSLQGSFFVRVFCRHTVGFIEEGKWPLLGNMLVPRNIVFPNYLIGTKDRDSYSPAVLEDAVKAKYGVEPWYTNLNELVYKL